MDLDYDEMDGLDMAAAVADKRVSPDELLTEAIRRAEKHSGLNAIVTEMFD